MGAIFINKGHDTQKTQAVKKSTVWMRFRFVLNS